MYLPLGCVPYMETPKNIHQIVFETLEDILLMPKSKINLTDRLMRDLHMHTDDATFDFAMGLQKKLNIKVPVEAWKNVYTVQDAINVLEQYRDCLL